MDPPSGVSLTSYRSDDSSWEMARRAPNSLLADHIEGYCGYEERGAPVRRREVPTGRVTMILSFEDTIDVLAMSNSVQSIGTFRSFVAGLDDGYGVTQHKGSQHGIQVDLAPLAAYRMLGAPMGEVASQVVELDALRGRAAGELTERLALKTSWEERFALLDETLLDWIDDGPTPDRAVIWAWRQMKRSHGNLNVATLAEEIGWSRRHFAARFREQVGLTPKPTGRVLRFRRAIELLTRGRPSTFADVAAESGYADQSHFVREFRALAGWTPTQWEAARLPEGQGLAG